MSKLIEEFKQEHVVIAETLQKVREFGPSSKESQALLMSAKSGLLAHLKKEDEKLYPVLKNASESDANLKQTLDFFAKDMEGITKVAMDFFEKYSGGNSGLEFAKSFGKFYAILSQRISKEENVIYKKYDELKH